MRHPIVALLLAVAVVCCAPPREANQDLGEVLTRPSRPSSPRIAPVEEPWTAQQRTYLEPYQREGRLFNVFKTAAHHPALASSFDGFAFGHLNADSFTLPARDRELLILRIGWLCASEYEWAQHARVARSIGFTDAEFLRIIEGPAASGWTPTESALLRAVDELHSDAFITDATWAELAEHYDTQQLMDLVFAVGTVSMVLNSLGIQLDDGLTGFPVAPQ